MRLFAKGYARLTPVRALERAVAELQAQLATGAAAVSRSDLQVAKLGDSQTIDIVAPFGKSRNNSSRWIRRFG